MTKYDRIVPTCKACGLTAAMSELVKIDGVKYHASCVPGGGIKHF